MDERISLVPLTNIHGEDTRHRHYQHIQIPEQSLRQRVAPTSNSNSSVQQQQNEDIENNSSGSDNDISKGNIPQSGNNSPSVLRSVLGASPFLMGPHTSMMPLSSGSSSSYNESVALDVDIENFNNNNIAEQAINNSNRALSLDNEGSAPLLLKRTRENVIIHFLLELRMLQVDLLYILFIIFYQFFHSAVTNVAYYQHAQLNAANRVPLKDIAFDMLPPLDGELWIVSEYIFAALLGVSLSCVISNLVVRWNAPHGRPIYCMQIVRRLGMTWIVCQTLRMISFLITTLPGASRQCRYAVPDGLTSSEMVNGPAPDEGNPS